MAIPIAEMYKQCTLELTIMSFLIPLDQIFEPVRPPADHVPGNWSLRYVMIGTPGEFPDGADYSLEYKGRGRGCVIGYAA